MSTFGRYTETGAIVRAADGATIPPDPLNSDYQKALAAVASGDTITPYEPPPVDLKAYAADKRWRVETGGITVNGAAIQTDRDSQAMITGAVVYLNNNPDATSVRFKAESGWVTLDKASMLAIGVAVGQHVQSCFDAEKAIDADIDTGTITAAAEVEDDGRWSV